jgi:hypothetical protein
MIKSTYNMQLVFDPIFTALHDANVDYLVVGGLAVVLHGHLRATSDIDIVLSMEQHNLENAMKALKELAYVPRAPVPIEQFANERIRESWIQEKGLTVFSLSSTKYPLVEIDLFVREPFDFQSAKQRKKIIAIDHFEIHVASIEDLIELKREAGRPLDLEDIKMLESIRDEKSE